MQRYELERTGDRPLAFEGELLAEASTRTTDGFGSSRWHEMAVYRTHGGRIVLAVTWRTRWQGELDHHDVWILDTADEVADALKGYAPTMYLMGFPPGRQFSEKQARLERDLTARYESAVSEVLAALGPEEIE